MSMTEGKMSTSVASNSSTAEVRSSSSTPRNPDDPANPYTFYPIPGNKNTVKCKLCNKEMSGGISRMKEHLVHKRGNVTPCPAVSSELMKTVNDYLIAQRTKKMEKIRINSILEGHGRFIDFDEGEEERGGEEDSIEYGGNVRKSGGSKRGAPSTVKEVGSKKTKQTHMEHFSPIKEEERKKAWKAIAEWAYEAGISFNAFRIPSFQTAVYAIGNYGRGMKAPSYYHMRVTLLKEVYDDTKQFVEGFRPYWKRFGCSIMSDFWTDGKGRCLINFLVNCQMGTVFLKSIDASEYVKDANLIVGMIEDVIEDVGEENIIQFITDNGSNYKLAGEILEQNHPKIFWSPCAAHCCNLMLLDIGEKMPRIKRVLVEARSIVVYIYNHTRVLSLMRACTKNNDLHRSCVTRFASQFYTLESLKENQNALRMMFVSEKWVESDFAKTIEGKRVASLVVTRPQFWRDVDFAIGIMAPLVVVIRLVDTEEKPCVGYIYEVMDRAKEQI